MGVNLVEFLTENIASSPAFEELSKTKVTVCGSATVVGL
jgi:hypothetical protein